jgi:glyoxylase-like metal-dependent hydrolase (beta-lactamase superfamily II)
VDSHYHFDHSGGLRGYAAEDVTILTHENNLAFYQEAWQAPRTLEPDLLSQSGKTPTFESVGDKHILTDGTRTMELYSLPGNDHTDGLLMAYLPAEKILFVSDVYSPGHALGDPDLGYPHPWNVQLMQHIQQRKLDVQQLVPVHGEVHPISDLIERVKPRM